MTCRCGCGRGGKLRSGYARACWDRWRSLGRPDVLPPPRRAGRHGSTAPRVEDYRDLRSWGETRESAAARLGVCLRTLGRYDAALRAGAA